MNSKNRRAGFSMIEALIALLLVTVIGGAVVYTLAQITAVTNQAKLRSQAQSLAEAGVENVRNYYQVYYWLALSAKANPTGICYKDGVLDSTDVIGCTAGSNDNFGAITGTPFGRRIRLTLLATDPNNKRVIVESVVRWDEKGRANNATDSAIFYAY